MKRILLFKVILFLMLSGSVVQAQDGDFFLTHYSPNGRVDNVNFDIVQDHKGVICIANRAGVLTFDGKNWDFFKTPSAIFTLGIDDNNVLYAGGRTGFGRLTRDQNYNLRYVSLSENLENAHDIFHVLIKGKMLFAINQSHIFIYDTEKNKTTTIAPKYSGDLIDLVTFEDEVYVTTTNSGLQLIEGTKLMSPRHAALKGLEPVFISAGPKKGSYLIATEDQSLYLFQDDRLQEVKISNDRGYIEESDLQDGIWFSDSLAALSTLKGGVVFIDPMKGEIRQIINYQTGLPDNEIFALAMDRNYGIWAAHTLGLTRISPSFPFRNFNRYPGLEGKMLSVKNHEGTLYVGTSLGAYYLEEVRDYNEIVHYVKVAPTSTNRTEQAQEQQQEAEVSEPAENDNDKKGGGIFGFLKRGKKKDKIVSNEHKEAEEISQQEATTVAEQQAQPVYKRKVERELQSIRYKYKKIEGIESKTLQFEAAGSRLFCGGLDGLFEVREGKATPISRLPVRYFYVSENLGKIFVSTYTDQLKVYDYTSSQYREVDIFGDYKDYVQYIFEDNKDRVWFCSTNDLYWVKLEGDNIAAMDEYQIDNPYYYETFGTAKNDSVFFINESGVYTINESEKTLTPVHGTPHIERYLPGSNGQLWVYGDQKWSTLVSDRKSGKLDLLGLFKNINYISTDADHAAYWVITENSDLYRLSNDVAGPIASSYQLFLKDIKTQSEVIPPSPELKFDQQNSNLIFEFVQPEYSGVLDIQYQYKLVGLNDTWSEWSSGYNVINFPYLPEGEYTLLVKSKNALGKISEAGPVSFEVIPPYWKRPWFYAFEFSTMALLLLLSVRLKKLDFKYKFISRLLALITLVIIIEFIQTVAENEFSLSSPVIDFIIQVIVAIVILPVEGLLRKFIFKEKDVKVLDFIKTKNQRFKTKINE